MKTRKQKKQEIVKAKSKGFFSHQSKEGQVKAYICPKCRSLNVGYVFTLRNLLGLIPKMKCKKCGYEAQIFPLLVVDKSKLKKNRK